MSYPSYINTYMPYNTYGFNPYQQQQIPPQPQPETQQPVFQKTTNCEWIFVNGVQQVKEHIVQPNQTFYFLDNNDPILYQKKADNLGSAQIKAYKITEMNLNDISSSTASVTSDTTKDELNALAARISQLENQMKMKEAIRYESTTEQSNSSASIRSQNQQSSGACTEYFSQQS